ncbi:MAG: DNA repair protein [Bacteroidetes bacterium]|nr:MAG: DNA repair protein [Bacteroidota bacterium]
MPKILSLTFPDLRLQARDAPKLRGYFADHFGKDSILFHNHTDDGGFVYGYSLIQYKVLQGVPTVVGINEGADRLLEVFMDIQEIELDGQRVPVNVKELQFLDAQMAITEELREYRFATPYFPFTQDNYQQFRSLNPAEQAQRLRTLLTNHLILALRDTGLSIDEDSPRLMTLPRLRPRLVNFKNQRMQMYTGSFTANVIFPPTLGVGKSISRGFGTVVPL